MRGEVLTPRKPVTPRRDMHTRLPQLRVRDRRDLTRNWENTPGIFAQKNKFWLERMAAWAHTHIKTQAVMAAWAAFSFHDFGARPTSPARAAMEPMGAASGQQVGPGPAAGTAEQLLRATPESINCLGIFLKVTGLLLAGLSFHTHRLWSTR